MFVFFNVTEEDEEEVHLFSRLFCCCIRLAKEKKKKIMKQKLTHDILYYIYKYLSTFINYNLCGWFTNFNLNRFYL